MAGLEDGEVLDSDEDQHYNRNSEGSALISDTSVCSIQTSKPNAPVPTSFLDPRNQPQATSMQKKVVNYRDSRPVAYCSSEDSNLSSDEDSLLWKQKRGKYSASCRVTSMDTCLPENGNKSRPRSNIDNSMSNRKVNDVWESVLTEQTLTHDLTGVGVHSFVKNRSVESYDYSKAQQDTRPFLADSVDTEVSHDPFDRILDENSRGERGVKRKKAVKDRIGPRTYDKTTSRDHLGVTEEDSEDALVNAISLALDEPKVSLLVHVVTELGKKKALELLYLTEDVEARGGMMTMDGYRRRTPGGVYIQLLKTDPEVSKKKVRKIFAEENKMHNKERKVANRNRHSAYRNSNEKDYHNYKLPKCSPSPLSNDDQDSNSEDISETIQKVRKRQVEGSHENSMNLSDEMDSDDHQAEEIAESTGKTKERQVDESSKRDEMMNTSISNEMEGDASSHVTSTDDNENYVLERVNNETGSSTISAANIKSFSSEDTLVLDVDEDSII